MIRQAVLEYDHSNDALDKLYSLIGNRKALVLKGFNGYGEAVRVSPRLSEIPSIRFNGECSTKNSND